MGSFQELNDLRLGMRVLSVSLACLRDDHLLTNHGFICALCEVLLSKAAAAHLPCIQSIQLF